MKTHNQLIEEGYVYPSRRTLPYSNDERRLYEKSGEDGSLVVLYVSGIKITEYKEYQPEHRAKALDHLANGSA